ncbi:MAG TPA: sulfatase-like hydrolase/transferase [Chloroflexota bacterium]|nr:sulfatase-like hydrolase/transferase [Chloroflexota bacterium]
MHESVNQKSELNPSRRGLIKGAAGVALAGALPAGLIAQPDGRPNVLFILADDLGYADLSCYGRRDYRTPALDRLAAQGMRLTQGYSNSAVCSPTRVALLTGRYHQRLPVGLPEPITTEVGLGLPAGHQTLPGLLRAAGYRTSLVGKWHMGWPPEHGPLSSGYDSFFGIAPGAADHFTHTFGSPRQNVLFDGDQRVERRGYLTDLLAERAVSEIRESAAGNRPFLLSLHFTAPHWPWQGPRDAATSAGISNLRHEDGGSLVIYAEMMASLDGAIARVLAELDARGLGQNTIVVFTSDNGGERFSDMWPLRGGKGELLEGGIRVPLIVRWPARVRSGSTSEQVMTSMDWLPTLAAVAGVSPDPRYPADGSNLLPVLTGTASPQQRKLYWRFRAGGQSAVRDGNWKARRIGDQEHLFDVVRDPRERANLKDREVTTFQRLRADFESWNATMLPYPDAGRRPS